MSLSLLWMPQTHWAIPERHITLMPEQHHDCKGTNTTKEPYIIFRLFLTRFVMGIMSVVIEPLYWFLFHQANLSLGLINKFIWTWASNDGSFNCISMLCFKWFVVLKTSLGSCLLCPNLSTNLSQPNKTLRPPNTDCCLNHHKCLFKLSITSELCANTPAIKVYKKLPVWA